MSDRDWELWDRPGVVPQIQKMWTHPAEVAHRDRLAALTVPYIRKEDRFLEVGCGTGLMYRVLAKAGIVNYTGVDTSMAMVRAAQADFPNVDFEIGDGYNLSFDPKSFDMVAAYDVIQHLPDMVPFLKELGRVARRVVLFTILETKVSVFGKQRILGNDFIENKYSRTDAKKRVAMAFPGRHPTLKMVAPDRSNLWIVEV